MSLSAPVACPAINRFGFATADDDVNLRIADEVDRLRDGGRIDFRDGGLVIRCFERAAKGTVEGDAGFLGVVNEVVEENGAADGNFFALAVFNGETAAANLQNHVGVFEGSASDSSTHKIDIVLTGSEIRDNVSFVPTSFVLCR